MKHFIFGLFFLIIATGAAHATAVVHWEAGNRWYERVETGFAPTWEAAQVFASVRGGYLASITSVEENNFIWGNLHPAFPRPWTDIQFYWLGGYRDGGDWMWDSGEDWDYERWWSSYEDTDDTPYLRYSGYSLSGYWDDAANGHTVGGTAMKGYIVEYESNPNGGPIPEPTTAASLLMGLLALGGVTRRRE